MSPPNRHTGPDYERYLELSDREACDELLTPDENSFCRSFERRFPEACQELQSYAELAELNAAPDAASRALVDRTLAQLEMEDAARASEEVRMLRGRRPPGLAILVAVAAFALGSGYALIKHGSSGHNRASGPLARAELVYTSGDVSISNASDTASKTLLSEGSIISTQKGAACVLIDSDINVCLAPDSRMRLSAIAGPARVVDLEKGKLATRLATQPEGMSLSIVADGVASTAVGTAYSVQKDPESGRVTTTVLNGKVRVGRGNEVLVVSAHERAITKSRGAAIKPTVRSVRRTEEAPSWALLGPTVLWHDPVAATLEVRGEPTGAEAWLDDQWLGLTPVSSLIPAGEHRVSVRKHNQEFLARDVYLSAGDSQDVIYTDSLADDTRSESAPSANGGRPADAADANADSADRDRDRDRERSPHRSSAGHGNRRGSRARDQARSHGRSNIEAEPEESSTTTDASNGGGLGLRQARQAVRAGQFRAAAAIYEQLTEGSASSEEASTAMVLLGQLRLNQLSDPKGALAPLNAYLKRGGPLSVEARVARIEALRRLHRTSEESSAIVEFLRLHPRSFEVKRLQARLNTLRETSEP